MLELPEDVDKYVNSEQSLDIQNVHFQRAFDEVPLQRLLR